MHPSRAITLLHLSDTQFGRNHRFGRLGLPEPDAPFDTLFARLCDDLRYLKDKHGLVPDLVIASGDVAEWGKKKEFEDVLDLLTRWSRDTTVRVWDPESGRELRRLEGHGNSVQSVAFSPDGNRRASGGGDNTVRFWDPKSSRALLWLEGHTKWVLTVAFNPDGKCFASGGGTAPCASGTSSRAANFAGSKGMGIRSKASPSAPTASTSRAGVRTAPCSSGTRREGSWPLIGTPEGWAAVTPDGRYKLGGDTAGAFWFAINLCRFEPGELDPYLPERLRRLAPEERIL